MCTTLFTLFFLKKRSQRSFTPTVFLLTHKRELLPVVGLCHDGVVLFKWSFSQRNFCSSLFASHTSITLFLLLLERERERERRREREREAKHIGFSPCRSWTFTLRTEVLLQLPSLLLFPTLYLSESLSADGNNKCKYHQSNYSNAFGLKRKIKRLSSMMLHLSLYRNDMMFLSNHSLVKFPKTTVLLTTLSVPTIFFSS